MNNNIDKLILEVVKKEFENTYIPEYIKKNMHVAQVKKIKIEENSYGTNR